MILANAATLQQMLQDRGHAACLLLTLFSYLELGGQQRSELQMVFRTVDEKHELSLYIYT